MGNPEGKQAGKPLAVWGDRLFLIGLILMIVFLVWEAILWPSGGGTPSCKECVLAGNAGFAVGVIIIVTSIALSLIAIARKRRSKSARDQSQDRSNAVENHGWGAEEN